MGTSSGGLVSYEYDGLGRLQYVVGASGRTNVSWEPGGARLTRVSGGRLAECRDYDDRGWLLGVTNADTTAGCSTATPHARYVYRYDARGNRIAEDSTDALGQTETTSYGYDAADRLTGSYRAVDQTATLYQLAADGTRLGEKVISPDPSAGASLGADAYATSFGGLEQRYRYDGQGALEKITDDTGATVATYQVDAAGRVRQEDRPGEQLRRAYDWDASGRLTAATVTRGVSGSPSVGSFGFKYDHAGLRVEKTGPGGTSSYLWGEDGLVLESLPGGQHHVYDRLGDLVTAIGGERIMRDGLGSVVGRVTAQGVASTTMYDAWGSFRRGEPGAADPSLAYAGQHWDRDLGLSYAQQRWYQPGVGRFLSEDPVFGDVRNPNSLQAFGYGNGNPLLYVDPSGELGIKPVNERLSTEQADYWMGVARNAPEGSPEKAEALRKYRFWMNEAKDARENIIFNEEVTFPAARDALAAMVVGPAAKAYSVVRWGLGLMSLGSGVSRLHQASQQQGTQRTGNLIAGTAEVVAGGLMFTPEVVEAAPKLVDAAKAMQQKASKFLDEFSVVPEGEVAGPGGIRMPVLEPARAPNTFEARGRQGGLGGSETSPPPEKSPAPEAARPSLSATKAALAKVHAKVGKLPKGQQGKFGSPQAGTPKKGYRLDPAHPEAPPGSPETKPHINWWDYTQGKRGRGGASGAVPIEEGSE